MKKKEHVVYEVTPLSGEDCFYIADRRKTEFTYPVHSHTEYELNFTENAAGVKRMVGNSTEVIGEYDLVLITSKDLEHVWEQNECKSKDIREITIHFSPDLFFKSCMSRKQFESIRLLLEKAKNGISFPLSAIMKVYSLLDTLSSEKDGFYSVVKFLTILHELSLCTDYHVLSGSSSAKVNDTGSDKRIQKVQAHIQKHYKEELRLNDLAELAGMTPVAFSRFFKQQTDSTLFDYIIDIRLNMASRLLVDTNMSVNDIMYEVGFNNISNFNRIFKKKKKLTPSDFRENYKKKKVIV